LASYTTTPRDFSASTIIIFVLIVYALLAIGTDAIARALERRANSVPLMTNPPPNAQLLSRAIFGHVDKWYGDHRVLTNVLRAGSIAARIFALIVAVGSGKSTVLRVLAGLSPTHTGGARCPGPRRWLSRSRGCFHGARPEPTWFTG